MKRIICLEIALLFTIVPLFAQKTSINTKQSDSSSINITTNIAANIVITSSEEDSFTSEKIWFEKPKEFCYNSWTTFHTIKIIQVLDDNLALATYDDSIIVAIYGKKYSYYDNLKLSFKNRQTLISQYGIYKYLNKLNTIKTVPLIHINSLLPNDEIIVKLDERRLTNYIGLISDKPIYTSEEGCVIVKIWVDQYGHVQRAEPGADGTTIINAKLWAATRKAAMNAVFNKKTNAPALQEGTITYSFD